MCRVLKVSRSGYYAYARCKSSGKDSREVQRKQELGKKVKAVYYYHRKHYGSRRISAELKEQGTRAGCFVVRRLMRSRRLRATQPRSFVPRTTRSDNTKASPNLVKEVVVNKPKTVLVGDITYLPLKSGKWCYLACWQDKFTRRIVGWKISDRMTDELVIDALDKALARGLVKRDAIIHSDRGSQYSSNNFRKLLKQHALIQSMSGRGNCYDNAQAESFWARFKTELVEDGLFESVDQARSETFTYIDGYYNRIRRHSALGYKSPEQFEKMFEIENLRNLNQKEFLSVRVVSI